LQAALANPALQQVKVLQEQENPVMWLQENLQVRFEGDSELLRVSLTLDEPAADLEAIVDAVCAAYKDEVITKERLNRIKIRDALVANHGKLKEEIYNKWEEFRRMSKELGAAEGQFDPVVRLLFEEIATKMRQKLMLEAQIIQIQQEFAKWKSIKDNPDLKEQQIDMQVAQDQDLMIMEQEMLGLRAQHRDAQKRAGGHTTREMRRIEKDMNVVQQQMNAQRQQVRERIRQQMAAAPDIELAIYTQEFQRQLQFAAARLQNVVKGRDIEKADGTIDRERGLEELKEELESKAEDSTELMIRQAELDQLEEVASDLARRIESWDIELQAEPRIQQVESAYVMPGINRLQRYAITGVGSALTLLLACLGIAYGEFMRRRLNGPDQLDEGLGIRVVGTLPALNAKRMMNPKHPLVAQLTESIDSVRTALMHDSTSKPRQVVLVTSPSAMEGRTTVASQLAASLARAGRRTLLIDGDLRRPALHSLFDVPLEDGLCEVLRAEAEVTDVVRPTHAEGLWLMTAGYCDADAVHAMATDQIQPIFEKLRADYDFVIIDGAPVIGLSDSLMMGQHCDGVLMSVLRDHTSVPNIYKASELLRDVGVRLIGSVVNGVSSKADRRVTHLQVASPKAARKQLESQSEEVGVATQSPIADDPNDLDDLDFSDLSSKD
jgi:polysaccharide biosynthesis transport protein